MKPIILVKVGRHAAGSNSMSHTASLVGSDDVFDAAVKRAGVVRVQSISQLFTAAKALSCGFHPTGNRLAIVTNGGGPGVMRPDRASDLGLNIAALSEDTINYLDQHLPPNWSHANPVDIIGDALDDRYHHSVKACLEDSNIDGVLVILTPQAMTKPLESAQEVIRLSEKSRKPLLACWMGETQVAEARKTFAEAKKPYFRTPEPAVEVFAHLSDYYRNQRLLMQMPGPLSSHIEPNIDDANIIIDKALEEHRSILSEMESKALLAAFHIPIAKTMIAHSRTEAVLIAEQLGFPIVMKVNSKEITHKSDIGGVILNITNAQEVQTAFSKNQCLRSDFINQRQSSMVSQ
jgi:acetyltransferase